VTTEPAYADLVELCELDDVRVYEFACRNESGFEVPRGRKKDPSTATGAPAEVDEVAADEDQRWDIRIKIGTRVLECRTRVTVTFSGCSYLVDAAAIYKIRSSRTERFSKLPRKLVMDFVEAHALSTIFPYVRTEVHQGAEKVRGDRAVFRTLSLDDVHEALASATSDSGREVEQAATPARQLEQPDMS